MSTHANMVSTVIVKKVKVATTNNVKDGGKIFSCGRRIGGMYESVKKC